MKHLLLANSFAALTVCAFFLVACEPSELRPVPIGGGISGSGSGGSYSAPAKSVPQQVPVNNSSDNFEGQESTRKLTIH